MDIENRNLDNQIKKALENFQVPFQENHWELMEHRLNDAVNGDLSEHSDDHIIREKLTSLNPKADPTDWKIMAAKLAALSTEPLMEDALVDGVAYENLVELKPPYNEAHWDLMEKKIEAELNWRNKVVRYKVMELALAFLFLFTFVQYWPNAKQIIQSFPEKTIQPAEVMPAEQNKIITSNPPIAQTQNQVGAENIQQPTIISNQSPASELTAVEISDVPTNAVATSKIQPSNNLALNKSTSRESQSFAQIGRVEQSLALPNLVEEEKNREDDFRNAAYTLANFDLLANVEESLLDQPDYVFPDCDDCYKQKSKSYFRIGTRGIGTVDFYKQTEEDGAILNREDSFNEITKVRSYEFGYGAGLSVGVRKNNWEFESGIAYSTKQTNPETIFLIADESLVRGRTGTAWVGSTLDLLQIPLNVRYDFINKTKWKFYGLTGTTLNVALNAIDRYQDIVLKEPQNFRAASGDSGKSRSEVVAVTQNGGISQGGNFVENTFLTIDLGLGVEKQLSSRYSVFLQSNYHQTLRSFGIRKDGIGIGTLGLQTGLKFSFLKRKPNLSSQISGHSHSGNINTK